MPPSSEPRLFLPREGEMLGGPASEAVEVALTGVVQGVGFRPFVHRLALTHRITGWVRNEAGAVRVRAEGPPAALGRFVRSLTEELPPLARIDTCVEEAVACEGLRSFEVVRSDVTTAGRLPVSPDVAMCAACETELRDPSNPRYGYPFITCTDCGPRFTVIEEMPYDRIRTTMGAFRQCPSCSAEYEAPSDRRYHSETNSCPVCGPRVWLELAPSATDRDEGAADAAMDAVGGRRASPQAGKTVLAEARGRDAIAAAAGILRNGRIVAVRGLGGFHLAVRADDAVAVERLRARKARDAKPLAVMVSDLAAVRALARLSSAEARILTSRERPVVVLRRREGEVLAPQVAPGLDSVGVMLAYTPLHHLLLDGMEGIPLVMTSGNVSDEPVAIGNGEARERLGRIADAFLLHDREIVARYDDSVVRVAGSGPVMIRRSRGYAPIPLLLPRGAREPILAVGPHLKNTFTLAHGRDAYVSQHIGDLETLETHRHFQEALRRFQALFHIRPRWVVKDMHPGYLSTAIAEESGLDELPPVQHHHAHVAAVMGEHGIDGPVLGLAFDGTGYGTDGTVWGCEMLAADLTGFRRLAHLRPVPLPGGDRAARRPWRSLLGYASMDEDATWAESALEAVDAEELRIAGRQIRGSLNTPRASSLGRLFDATAALLGIGRESRYEGQAPMELEAAAGSAAGRVLPFPVVALDGPEDEEGPVVLDPVPLLRALAQGRHEGRSVGELAADFHASVVAGAARLAEELALSNGLETVVLGGGCFQNVRLVDGMVEALEGRGLEVLLPRVLSPNDSAVSYGQAVVAAARMSDGPPTPEISRRMP